MAEEHPAQILGQKSRDAVARGDREAWLALWADDAVIEDPIGVSPLDPTGKGQRGKQAIAEFWDQVIRRDSRSRVSFDYHTQYCVGNECACVGSLTHHLPDGATFQVSGVFVYRATDDGKLASLRTYWEYENGVFTPAEGPGA